MIGLCRDALVEVSEFVASHPPTGFAAHTTSNRHGILFSDDSVTTLAGQGETQNGWWQNTEAAFPYLILVDGVPAGFNLIAARPLLGGIEAEFVVYEFFVLHPYRGKGVAEQAAIQGFDAHQGKWEIVTYPTHARAIAFWRRVLTHCIPSGFTENEIDHPWGRKVAFHFENSS